MTLITTIRMIALALALALVGGPAMAGDDRDDWDDDAPAFGFLFGNHIDTHQLTRMRRDGTLSGVLLIYYTGETDPDSGLPVARHPRGAMQGEECGIDLDCVVGWKLRGRAGAATFLYHSGVNGNDHPVWLVGRKAIPQPGAYSHFHWITSAGTEALQGDLDIPPACDVAMAGALEGDVAEGTLSLDDGAMTYSWAQQSVHLGGGAEGVTCPGWFLQLKAVASFAFQHGGEILPVTPGPDIATHLNLVTNYALVPGITGSGGMHGGH